MEYHIGTKLYGFVVDHVSALDDLNAKLVEMHHEKTKAKLVYLDRDEENQTFCIGFKTTPTDDTGVFHILEHSVLNGSRKYPVKEPFVDLLKTSLQTFLNAMTYPDKTIYPVSSRNDQDFLNLMDVYLDAVFHPAIYTNPKIFQQEGWHYEIRDKQMDPLYKGVVFNEMKGALSDVDETIINTTNQVLFKDTCYRYISGGDPVSIVDLSYEKFIETHQKYYHPSNSYIFLDGRINLENTLTRIDSFLDEYEYQDCAIMIDTQEDMTPTLVEVKHPIGENEDPSNKTNIAFAKILSDYHDAKKILMWQVLSEVLVGSNEAPLKKALLEKQLAEDVELAVVDGILQPYLICIVRNTEKKHLEEIEQTINQTLSKVIEDKISITYLTAILNQMEFRYREVKEPSGVIFASELYKSWLYGGDPSIYLDMGHIYKELKEEVASQSFENVLKEDFDLCTCSKIVVLPDQKLSFEKEEKEKQRLHKIKQSWSETQLDAYIENNLQLDAWQMEEDSKEAKASLPQLKKEEIRKLPEKVDGKEIDINGVPVMVYEAQASGITYCNLYFNIAGVKKEELPSLSFYVDLLGNLPTKSHSLMELKEAIQMNFGTLVFHMDSFADMEDVSRCIPTLTVTSSFLQENKQQAKKLILEVLQETIFDEDMILTFAKQSLEKGKQDLIQSGHAIALNRVNAHFNSEAMVRDCCNGLTYTAFLKDFVANFEEWKEDYLELCTLYQEHIATKNRLLASVTGEEGVSLIGEIIEALPLQEFHQGYVSYPLLKDQMECVVIPSEISYSATGFINQDPNRKKGAGFVLAQIMTYGYLWNEIRVKGGAYGTSLSATATGIFSGMSYRDPTPFKSVEIIQQASSFIHELAQSEESIDPYIIGTIASVEPLLSPQIKYKVQDGRWLRKISYEDRCNNRLGILETKAIDFKQIADIYEEKMKDAPVCIVGPKSIFQKEDHLINLFE